MSSLFPRLDALTAVDNRARVIVFENLELAIRIGAYASEKLAAQRVRISIEMLVVPPVALASDRLEEVVNYDTIHGAITALFDLPMSNSRRPWPKRWRGFASRRPMSWRSRSMSGRSTSTPTATASASASSARDRTPEGRRRLLGCVRSFWKLELYRSSSTQIASTTAFSCRAASFNFALAMTMSLRMTAVRATSLHFPLARSR